jgi:glutaredoxin-related protein
MPSTKDLSPASSQVERNVFVVWYSTGVVQREFKKSTLKILSDRKKEKKNKIVVGERTDGRRKLEEHKSAPSLPQVAIS